MVDTISDTVDVAIVGGGIVGCAAAWHLAEAGARVSVFERGMVASEQSSRAWGFIRQQGRNSAELPLAVEANRLWSELTERYGQDATHLTRRGILVPAETKDDEERVVRGHEVARKFDLDTKLVDRSEIGRLLSELRGDWRCALYTPQDGHGDPLVSTRTIADAARQAGAQIFEQQPVFDIATEGGRIVGVTTRDGICRAGAVVVAAGIGSPRLMRRVGLDLPIQVITSSVAQTRPADRFTEIAIWAPRVAYRPRSDGSFVIGNGYRGVGADYNVTPESVRNLRYFLPAYRRNWRLLRLTIGGDFISQIRGSLSTSAAADPMPEPKPNFKKIHSNMGEFRNLFPHLGAIELDRAWAGRIDLTPDVIPIIDKPDPDRSLIVAAGFSGHGFALGPSVGKQVAEWLLSGRPSLDLRPFRLSRFAEGDMNVERQAL